MSRNSSPGLTEALDCKQTLNFTRAVMESYEDFIQRLYSRRYNDEDEDDDGDSYTPSSVIVFHGARVLPPLLNEQQRAEMRGLRDTAVRVMMMKKMRRRRREEESQISFGDDEPKSDDIISSAPLTSTARSANQPRASPEAESPENSLITVRFEGVGCKADDHSHSQMMMMSSGYVTNDNTDVTCRSSWIEGGAVQLGTTQPTTTGSDIISHAPVDGVSLEEEEEEEKEKEKEKPSKNLTELENPPSDPDEGPYRMSLQNLLKKSQEYRRRQRQLRSQARALKPAAADEHSLSDKENEEQISTADLRKARKTDDEDALPRVTSTALPVTAGSRCSSAAGKRFSNIPTPVFCLSPVRSIKKASGIPRRVREALSESDPSRADFLSSLKKAGRMSEQTEQIAQLELNLSSLKALISDLESTLTLSQTEQAQRPGKLHQDSGISPENTVAGVLTDTANRSETNAHAAESSVIGSSYDVDAPSSLWTQVTPEVGGHEGVSRVKRRLLMNEGEAFAAGRETGSVMSSVMSSAQTREDPVTALMEGERRRQQELLQSLAVRYRFLRSVSFPCPSAGSRLEDTSTSVLASSVCSHTELTDALHTSRVCVPLLAALVKGFLTRRLLRTERVSRLIRTIKDTQVFLQSFQHQTAGRLDLLLQDRVTLQLRAARHELHRIFFSWSSCERMQTIRCDRELSRERRRKPRESRGFLSSATRKALERKKQKLFSGCDEQRWNLVPKICRVSKSVSAR